MNPRSYRMVFAVSLGIVAPGTEYPVFETVYRVRARDNGVYMISRSTTAAA